jgi:Putative adhesin
MNGDTAMTTVPATRPPRAPAPLPMTPGRWITLMIGVPIVLALIGWTGFSLATAIGRASYPVTGTIPLEHGKLVASMDGSDITLQQDQARGSTARLVGTVNYSLVHPSFTVIGTAVNLNCRLPSGNCGLNATLDVPADTPVDLATGGGNVQASGIQRDVTMDTVGGDVTVNDLFSPHVKLETGGGNVALTFTKVPASLDIASGGGDITVVLPHSTTAQYDISYQTGGGDYSAPGGLANLAAKDHTITLDSGGGNVNISEAS